jgi:hypothetical protein
VATSRRPAPTPFNPRTPHIHPSFSFSPLGLTPEHRLTSPFPSRAPHRAPYSVATPTPSPSRVGPHLTELMLHSSASSCSGPPRAPPAERPPPSLLHGELHCSPSPSQNGSDSSCSFSLWSSGTRPHHRWPPEGIIAVENPSCHRCSATSTVLCHLGEPHPPSSCTMHAPWSPLAHASHLLPPRPPTSHHRPRRCTSRSRSDRALRGRRTP